MTTNGNITISLSATALVSILSYGAYWLNDTVVTKAELLEVRKEQQQIRLDIYRFILNELEHQESNGEVLTPHQKRLYDELIGKVDRLEFMSEGF